MNLKELSEKLGLSQTTVSRALNGYPEVSETTRRRVQDFARQMNYQPNSNARRLATGKSSTIGHVVPLSSHDMINPHFSDFIAGAGEIYNRHGYDMLISVVSMDAEQSTYETLYRNRRIDGMIVHGPRFDDERIALLTRLKVPFVVHGRTNAPEDSYSWVDVDNRRTFHEAATWLLDAGHRRIGLINGPEFMTFAIWRREGFENALRERGLEPDPAIMTAADMIEPNGHAAMTRFLEQDNPPTAVLCSSMLTSLGALRAVREHDLKPGRDISVIGFDDCLSFLPAMRENPAVSVVQSSIRLAGKACATMLIDQIERNTGPQSLRLDTRLLLGASTGPAPGG
ncbi:substrate-binding domain-containing protein [Oricola sp.]|uniref:LacI family DNA-binding transcriptional regulator n=1 Tax=Oricola sp. TaxID=1979950 RepID=UPI0025F3246A|nr:substrate-binding domain-containing protein [Oricola sp.]MCI5077741.1 substrate-binding domain-containing protein [Oricola sp.]